MRTQLKRGTYETIYIDPLTRTQIEGKAKLIRQLSYDPMIERWEVIFKGETRRVVRAIVPVNKT